MEEKIFVYNKSKANAISLLILSIFLILFSVLAYYYTYIGLTQFGEVIALICIIISLFTTYFGIRYFFEETQILVRDETLVIKERFNSKEDRYPKHAIESLYLRKEVQEMVSYFLLLSFSTKSRPWSLSLKPKDNSFGQRIILYRGSPNKVKELTEKILRHFDWPLEDDTSEPSLE